MSTYEPRRSAEEMLAELEGIDATIQLKLEREGLPDGVRRRYETELLPRLEDCRALAARRATRARNALMDTLVLYREFSFTALATIGPAVF